MKAKFDPHGLLLSKCSNTMFGDVMAKSHDVSTLWPCSALKDLYGCKEDIHYAPDHNAFVGQEVFTQPQMPAMM